MCDDTVQTTVIRVSVPSGSTPFKSGVAAVDGNLFWSNGLDYFNIQDSEEVRILR